MLRKILYLLALILIVFTSIAFAQNINNKTDLYEAIVQRGKMIVGISFDSKPFGFVDKDGTIKGMEVDFAKEIAGRILGDRSKIQFKNINSEDRIHAVSSGDVDMVISTMTITPQRKKVVDFSSPYFVAGQVICVKRDSKIDSLDDLMNKRIIVILGTTGEKNIKRFAPNALIRGYVNNSEAINAFKNSTDGAITTDDSLLQGLVMENTNYMILPRRLTKEPYGIAFKKSKQTKFLRRNVNRVINEIEFDGTLGAIKDKWGIH